MKLKPWYDVVKPREDLREGKPMDASEFAVHLDKVRLKSPNISKDYTDPARFFDRTYLTDNLVSMAGEVVRRLSGITTEASPIFNTMTQFGGGKTHALTLLFHLATCGPKADALRGVSKILERAQVTTLPKNCAVGVFVGTEFDSLNGRGGKDGTPLRRTPWGEIAFQIGGAEGFANVARHDSEFIEPKGDVIEKMLPTDRPCLILMDEVLSYFSTYRQAGYGTKLYNFIQALSETCRGRSNCVLIVSAPKSDFDYSYTADDVADLQRLENLLQRLSKAIILSAESDACEIIRRRLFEWDDKAVTSDGRVLLSKEAHETCKAFGDWVQEHRQQLPDLVNADIAREQFLATYPFHPMTISVFERKWQALPRFQRTRGILRVLALWVSRAYQDGYKGAQRDPLITLGTAPFEDTIFRAAVFEQLGETRLDIAVTTDIAGKKDAHAIRLDAEAVESIRKTRLHRKAATTVFFESNGGQVGREAMEASLPEIRLAVGEPELDIGNVETVLDALTEACYFMVVEKTRYHFSLKENLNKRFSDRRAIISQSQADELVRAEVQKAFAAGAGVDRVYFPEKTIQIPDRPAVTFVILPPERSLQDDKGTVQLVETMTREYGSSSRTFKSALIFCVPESPDTLRDDARKVLAWEAIESDDLKLDDTQINQLADNLKKARRDLKESIWRTYKNLMLLGKDNSVRRVDMGLIHSSQSADLIGLIVNRLSHDGELETKGISPGTLIRNWPPAFKEWSTKSMRDAFFASPQFPRLTNVEMLKETISRGVGNGQLGYVGKTPTGEYKPFAYNQAFMFADVEFSDEMFIISKETADAYLKARTGPAPIPPTPPVVSPPGGGSNAPGTPPGGEPQPGPTPAKGLKWTGEVPPQKWMNFYTKVLSKFASGQGLKLTVKVEAAPEGGVSKQKVDETKSALRELGLDEDVDSV